MRILAARGQDPVLITSLVFLFIIFFTSNDNTFRIRYKPVDDCRGNETITVARYNNIHGLQIKTIDF